MKIKPGAAFFLLSLSLVWTCCFSPALAAVETQNTPGKKMIRTGQVKIYAGQGHDLAAVINAKGEVLEEVGRLDQMSEAAVWCIKRAASRDGFVHVIGIHREYPDGTAGMDASSLECVITACPVYEVCQ